MLCEKYKLINLNVCGDSEGSLIPIENSKDIPFNIQRIFYIYNVDEKSFRGSHANRFSQFCLICVAGSCKVKISGKDNITFTLDTPDKALYIDKMVWKEMFDFSSGAVLLVLSDCLYNPDEYIRSYDEYERLVYAK